MSRGRGECGRKTRVEVGEDVITLSCRFFSLLHLLPRALDTSTRGRPSLVYRDPSSKGQDLPPVHQGLHKSHLVESRQALPMEIKELGDVGGGGGSGKHRGDGGGEDKLH